ncbi:2-octaprenyl-6-methoxyphenol hydroxylase [Meinhardsimonia xiamenensis]|jgi:2-octaprenyl-6-methoxyphenol hydroxylase|uniref:2-octaprenyl-6-methoxyphenol hydroxylase n=1 Tax=Meinhardsimonia xiamenensis TaxID=990712 RepID=A0A1G9D3I8_9RHOB|nr:FAD-dependent monooxygenase [Meinhardsimonia xiamenensis]PRX38142.1 2-octaprenyl-6-methoxyphenol hydroxylase [Meinhardsimonia xiamenensis]SDK58522.1 2-octaprenyl-6-methoxyphenol hydroxylase [Meinhardsimonia xiamenensis]
MSREERDVVIAGGGLAGLIAAAAFAAEGFSVLLADPAPQGAVPEGARGPDLRSTAFLRPAQALLERSGLWERLAPFATPLEALEAVDSTGWPPRIRARRLFRSDETGATPFGWNLMNAATRAALIAHLRAETRVELALGTGFRDMLARDDLIIVRLLDGRRIAARLLVGADGRESAVRDAAGIEADTTRYGQKALTFTVSHSEPHHNVSTEIYNEGGAFTLVPLGNQEGRPASAVVWMNDGREALRLMELERAAFERTATERSCALYGPLRLLSARAMFPVLTRRARRLTAGRVALVAEAAHTLPPIGAQGLNTSLVDVAALVEAARAHGDGDPGAEPVLAAYARARSRDIAARAAAIDLFNRVCRSGAPPVQALRALGLRLVHDIAPLRRQVMLAGLGGHRASSRP